jgi:NitT/TauT family transport system substrate-binding protein
MNSLVRKIAAAASSVLLLAMAGCGALDEGGSPAAGASAKAGAKTVRVGYLHTIAVDDKLWLGQLDGIFAKHGINIKATQFDTGIEVSQALAGGSLDVAIMGGVTSNFPAQGQGKIFMANSVENNTAQMWVQPDSGISSVADLRGKTIATTEGTTADIYLLRALNKAGLKRSDVKVVNTDMPSAVQAFASGSVDAIALWVPFDLRVKEAVKGARMIDSAGNYSNAKVVDGWIANNEWYAQNQPTIKKLIAAWLDTNDAFRADPQGSLKKVYEAAYKQDAKLSDIQHQFKYQTDYTNEEWLQHFQSGEVSKWVGQAEQAYVELGGVPQYVEPNQFFDTSLFVNEAQKAAK